MSSMLKIKKSLRSVKILLVEDDALIYSLIKDVLEVMGFSNITYCKTGESAIEEIRVNSFDLILCDWKLSGISGLEFTKKLREIEDSKRYAPIIMITGKSREADVKEARDAGVTEYMIKPFKVNALCEKIKYILEKPRNFVIAGSYIGPDRRRKDNPEAIPNGIDRREG